MRNDHAGFVYFLTDGSAIKVGFAVNVQRRLYNLQSGNPNTLRLLGYFPGTPADEDAIHRRLGAHHILGDWFAIHDDVFDALRKIEQHAEYVEGDSDAEYQERVLERAT
jgi:hypothetical protein